MFHRLGQSHGLSLDSVSTPNPQLVQSPEIQHRQLRPEEGRCSRSLLSPGVRNDPLLTSFFTTAGLWLSLYFAFDISLCRCLLFFAAMLQTSCMKPAIAAQGCIFQLSFDQKIISLTHNTMETSQGHMFPLVCG